LARIRNGPQIQQPQTQRARDTGGQEGRVRGEAKAKKGKKSGKAKGKKGIGGAEGADGAGGAGGIGVGTVDAFDLDPDEQRRRARAYELIGEDEEYILVERDGSNRDLMATVAPEYLAQVTSGIARAHTLTIGSTSARPDDDEY
jgi:hypothetical protein